MDLDDIDGPSQVPSRTSRFAPKSSKLKPKPKSEPISKPEPQESVPKPEPQELDATAPNKKEEQEAIAANANANANAKAEASTSDGAVKMDIDGKSGGGGESKENDAMDVEDGDGGDDGGEDVVVREIDVFFNPAMDDGTKLYVMQYPLRPCWRPYELDDRCEEVRVKPVSAQMEVDLKIDVDSKNYDKDFGERLDMTKQTLSSSWKVPLNTGYAVGVLMGNKLHLNSIHAVVQFRPSLKHPRAGGSKRKNNVAGDAEVSVELEESAEEKSVGPSKKQNKRMEPSTEKKTDDEEPWVALKYHGSKTDFSARYLQRMVAQEGSPIQFTMNPSDYVDSLCPGAGNNIKPKGPSTRLLLSLPLGERIKKLLCEGPPVQRFKFLKHFAPDYSNEEFLLVLQEHALLIHGVWTPKSILLNQEGSESYIFRNYTLLLFREKLTISESDFPLRFIKKLQPFLEAFAVNRSSFKSNDWKFKRPSDDASIKPSPEILKAQNDFWAQMEKDVYNAIGIKKDRAQENNAVSKPIMTRLPRKTVNSDEDLAKNASVVSSGRKTMSEEARVALPKVLPKVFQTHKVCSFQQICQGLRDLALSQSTLPKADARRVVDAASGVDAPEELKEFINQVATEIHGRYVLKSSAEHPEYDPLRKVVINLLRGGGPDVKLRRAEVSEAAKMALKRDITNIEYTKVMSDICVSKGSAWVLKSSDGNSK